MGRSVYHLIFVNVLCVCTVNFHFQSMIFIWRYISNFHFHWCLLTLIRNGYYHSSFPSNVIMSVYQTVVWCYVATWEYLVKEHKRLKRSLFDNTGQDANFQVMSSFSNYKHCKTVSSNRNFHILLSERKVGTKISFYHCLFL